MISEQEIIKKVELHSKNYCGQLDHLYQAVGLIVVGRLFGWRVMRLTSSRRCWDLAKELFGDPKELLPERGLYAYRSLGLKLADEFGHYWDVVTGRKSIPQKKRRILE